MNPDRAFLFGTMVGIVMVFACFAFVSYVAGVKWQPVYTEGRPR